MVSTAENERAVAVDGAAVHAVMLSAASLRAGEEHSACPLFTDPCARVLLTVAAARGWPTDHHDDGIPAAALEAYVACRTRWFDQHFVNSGARGVDQAVILAAGLDTRAWRLPGSTVYEIDTPQVLRFKGEALEGHDAEQSVTRYVAVPVDARTEFSAALRQAGFHRGEPAAWSLEGMLPGWSAGDRADAVRHAVELSRPCSRLAVELPDGEAGVVGDWLTERGWEVTAASVPELLDRYARCEPDGVEQVLPRRTFVAATLL